MLASSNGHHAMVHLLLEHKASVDLQDAEGRTALMGAGEGFWAVHVDGDAEELSESIRGPPRARVVAPPRSTREGGGGAGRCDRRRR